MRIALLALGIVAAGLLAASALVDWRVQTPPVAPTVEQICADTMRRTAPDRSWVAPGREEKVGGREITAATLGELPFHAGRLVRVAGVLHVEFEWVALYPSSAAIVDPSWRAPWVTLDSLWPDEPYWHTKAPSISDRCVVVEGTYSAGAGGHMGMFNGTIAEVLRLDVWSTPHRPFVGTPAPPPPPPAKAASRCSEKPSPPEQLPDAGAGREMSAAFDTLYETGAFHMGHCVADVHVNAGGTVDAVRVRLPQNVDTRVESIVVRSLKSRQYKPATACGYAVPVTVSVSVFHCPSQGARGRAPVR